MSEVQTSIDNVVSGHMCTGCGACAYIDSSRLVMIDTVNHARRPSNIASEATAIAEGSSDPRATNARAESDRQQAAAVCPGINWPAASPKPTTGHPELHAEWGPILEIWEGFAVDPEIRYRGSSGGAVTALALSCIEQGGMQGVLHVRARSEAPLLNETVLSTNRESLIQGAGSRYSPASPCEELGQIEQADAPCVFIGKPCDVAAAVKARELRPQLDKNLGLTIAIFCAGTPSLQGTLELARNLGAQHPEHIKSIRYRGHGWPGEITATWHDPQTDDLKTNSISYEEGWGQILQKHRSWRCHVCADHTGEMADVSVGDPWYRPIGEDDPGRSLILVRTERGRALVREAAERGYLKLERRESWVLEASQPHLLRARGSTWGRTVASRLLGVAAPRHHGVPLLKSWWKRLAVKAKVQSLTGTATRVFKKRLRIAEQSVPFRIPPASATSGPSNAKPMNVTRPDISPMDLSPKPSEVIDKNQTDLNRGSPEQNNDMLLQAIVELSTSDSVLHTH